MWNLSSCEWMMCDFVYLYRSSVTSLKGLTPHQMLFAWPWNPTKFRKLTAVVRLFGFCKKYAKGKHCAFGLLELPIGPMQIGQMTNGPIRQMTNWPNDQWAHSPNDQLAKWPMANWLHCSLGGIMHNPTPYTLNPKPEHLCTVYTVRDIENGFMFTLTVSQLGFLMVTIAWFHIAQ